MAERHLLAATDGRSWVQRAVHLAQQVMCALYITVALLGVLFTPPLLLLTAGPAVGLVAVGVLAGFIRYCEQRHASRRTLMLTAAVATALVPFNEGVEVLQGLGAAIAVIVLVLMTVVGNYRMSQLAAPGRTGATSAGGAASYAELLSVMPLDTVLSEWRALDRGVGIPPGEQHWPDVVHVRGLLLDEMQRRDPVGFGSWMEDGAADDPERHIHDDPGLAA